MIETEWNALRERVESFPLDAVDAMLPFSARLAREQGWSLGFAARVSDEYKRFILLTVAAGHPVTPSEEVDAAWHLHLLYTRSYWDEFCQAVLGKPIHHEPTRGGMREGDKFTDWYEKTLSSYERLFHEVPPVEIWPPVEKRFNGAGSGRWVQRSRYFIIPRPATILKLLPAIFRNP